MLALGELQLLGSKISAGDDAEPMLRHEEGTIAYVRDLGEEAADHNTAKDVTAEDPRGLDTEEYLYLWRDGAWHQFD